MPDVTVNRVRLHYDEAGSGPPGQVLQSSIEARRMIVRRSEARPAM